MNKKTTAIIVIAMILFVSGYFVYSILFKPANSTPVRVVNTPVSRAVDLKNLSYAIDGETVTLKNGVSEVPIPDSASVVKTAYFGNEVKADMNGDGVADVAFILTQQTGGTGTFYYLAAALSTKNGYIGTNGFFLGDRIAPQTTEYINGQIVVNYADRHLGEAMTVAPSVGVSKFIVVKNNTLVEVPAAPLSESEARSIAERNCVKGGEALRAGTYNENSKTWWFDANLNATRPGCNPACVVDAVAKTAEINWRCTGLIKP